MIFHIRIVIFHLSLQNEKAAASAMEVPSLASIARGSAGSDYGFGGVFPPVPLRVGRLRSLLRVPPSISYSLLSGP